jgi:aminomethyltransferase
MPDGGVLDDLIITRLGEQSFFLVLNASRKEVDIAWITEHLPLDVTLEEFPDRALIALQGPLAAAVLAQELMDTEALKAMPTMAAANLSLKDGTKSFISRTGYTGEDGFEISLPGALAPAFWAKLLTYPEVKAIGLGARDSLRLEMGYPLYGHDLDDTTSPVEAGLAWVMDKQAEQYVGAKRIRHELLHGASRKRVGIKLLERGIARDGMAVFGSDTAIGVLCSGGFSPSLQQSIAMSYLPMAYSAIGTALTVEIRDQKVAAEVVKMPFLQKK